MQLQWKDIKQGVELLQDKFTSIFVISDIGRIYVTEKDTRLARSLGGNPMCDVREMFASTNGREPLMVIAEMRNDVAR